MLALTVYGLMGKKEVNSDGKALPQWLISIFTASFFLKGAFTSAISLSWCRLKYATRNGLYWCAVFFSESLLSRNDLEKKMVHQHSLKGHHQNSLQWKKNSDQSAGMNMLIWVLCCWHMMYVNFSHCEHKFCVHKIECKTLHGKWMH